MWRQALSELRLHPGRFVATLIAIAISVGFIAAISVFINTEQTALGKTNTMPLANADVYVNAAYSDGGDGVLTALEKVDGVRAVHPVPYSMPMLLNFGDKSVMGMIYTVPVEELRWSKVAEGRLPATDRELALSEAGLKALGAKVGDKLSPDNSGEARFTIVGATDDPGSLWSAIGYLGGDTGTRFEYAVQVADGASPETVAAAAQAAVAGLAPDIEVSTADAARQRQLDHLTNDFDVFKYLLQTFGVVALVVGMITIANTFTILVAQRRRQIGLLRAVGASPGQVMGRLIVESFLLGLVGSLLGIALGFAVAALGGTITGSLYWGFDIRWSELALALVLGIVATMISAIAPAITASRVKPLEALQVVPTAEQVRRAGIARIVVVVLGALAGAGLVAMSRLNPDTSVLWAVAAGVFITVAVLAAAPFFVPPMLRGLGAIFGRFGPTARLAFTNAGRNPKRAAATATALMLAVGLIVTLQVALATARTSGTESILSTYPVDFSVTFPTANVPAELVEQLEDVPNVAGVLPVPAKETRDGLVVFAQNELLRQLGKRIPADAPPRDGEILVPEGSILSGQSTITLPGAGAGNVSLTVRTGGQGLNWNAGSVNQSTLDQLLGDTVERELWITLEDRGDISSINQVMKVLETHPEADFSASGAGAILVLNQILGVMLIVLTGLLGVAVVIALVGVSNTLGLSVIERQRESALLRALGMQRGGLRWMLLVEAVALVTVGVVVGLVAGMFFGWLGVSSALLMIPGENVQLHFSIDWLYTAGLILVCLVAAILASLLPGQKAASAPPTEALAAE
ncbi:MAG: FtsX-like permease family protein [Propionibacteriaceae bacterium]|nr:FtsX-like permease family protein [Propionibacteriaceae bacterium]